MNKPLTTFRSFTICPRLIPLSAVSAGTFAMNLGFDIRAKPCERSDYTQPSAEKQNKTEEDRHPIHTRCQSHWVSNHRVGPNSQCSSKQSVDASGGILLPRQGISGLTP